jgi:hypothetical protein
VGVKNSYPKDKKFKSQKAVSIAANYINWAAVQNMEILWNFSLPPSHTPLIFSFYPWLKSS